VLHNNHFSRAVGTTYFSLTLQTSFLRAPIHESCIHTKLTEIYYVVETISHDMLSL